MNTTIRRELRHARRAWPGILADSGLLSGDMTNVTVYCISEYKYQTLSSAKEGPTVVLSSFFAKL
jgi:hypothetical protein